MRCSADCPTAGDGAPPPGPETTGPPASAERLTTEAGLSVGPPPENPVLCRAISASVLPGLPGRIPFFDLAKPRNLAETPRVADFPDAFHERIPRRARCRGGIVESLVSRASRQTSGTRQSACGAGAGTRCRRRAVSAVRGGVAEQGIPVPQEAVEAVPVERGLAGLRSVGVGELRVRDEGACRVPGVPGLVDSAPSPGGTAS